MRDEEPLVEESKEHELSTDPLFITSNCCTSMTDYLVTIVVIVNLYGFLKASPLCFGSSKTLTLLLSGPKIAQGSQMGDWIFVATNIVIKSLNFSKHKLSIDKTPLVLELNSGIF